MVKKCGAFQEAEAPRFLDNSYMEVVRSALRTGRLYPPGSIPGTHFCQRVSRSKGHCAAGRIMSMKNSNDTIGNRTRDLPACSAVPQPTAYVAFSGTTSFPYHHIDIQPKETPPVVREYGSNRLTSSLNCTPLSMLCLQIRQCDSIIIIIFGEICGTTFHNMSSCRS